MNFALPVRVCLYYKYHEFLLYRSEFSNGIRQTRYALRKA